MPRSREALLDFSLGDPLYPLKRLASHAFRAASRDMNIYHSTSMAGLGQPVGEILVNVSQHFTQRGFYPSGWSGLGTRGLLMTGGGTTEAYELIIRGIAENCRALKIHKPVIVMPVPTYGFFFKNPENWGIEVVPVERDWRKDGALDARKLWQLFQTLNNDGKRIVAYYDCNPHNPLGTVRTRTETENVARVIMHQNRLYQRDGDSLSRSERLGSQISIIDDMIYSGLEYQDTEKAVGFAQLEREEDFRGIFKTTFTLFGPSKAGMVNIRAGLLVGHDRHINDLRDIQKTTSYFPPKLSMHALEAFYTDDEKLSQWRNDHLDKMNEDHRFAGVLMKTLVNGLPHMSDVTDSDLQKMRQLVSRQDLLMNGIPGLEIITSPGAGFFHLLDFSGLKGRVYSNRYVHYKAYSGVTEFDGEEAISHLTESHNIRFAYGSWAGLKHEDCVVRASFAKPVSQILQMADRLRAVSACCSIPGPDVKRGMTPS